MILPIPVYGNTRMCEKLLSVNENSLYVYETLKSMEENPYFCMEYLRLLFTVKASILITPYFLVNMYTCMISNSHKILGKNIFYTEKKMLINL